MKRHREIGFILLAIVVLAVVGCTVGQATIPQAEEVQAAQAAQTGDDAAAVTVAVNEIWDEYESSLNAGDVDRWIVLWTEDGVQLPPGSPPVVGKEKIRERNKGALVDQFTVDMGISNEEVEVAGDWAVARGTYTAALMPKAGGEAVSVDGKYMTLLQRQPDGSWKIHRNIFNSNVE